MMICYDKAFPESARALALDGAEIVMCLSAWPARRTNAGADLAQDRWKRRFDLFDRARALENQIVWLSANQAGGFGSLRFVASAKVVDPGGDILADTGIAAGMAVAELDVAAALDGARRSMDHLRDRRPHAYPCWGPQPARCGNGHARSDPWRCVSVTGLARPRPHFGRDLDFDLHRIAKLIERRPRGQGPHYWCCRTQRSAATSDDLRHPDPEALPPALEPDDPLVDRVAALAAEMVVCFGYCEADGDGRYNSAVCVHRRRRARPPPQGAPARRGGRRVPAG